MEYNKNNKGEGFFEAMSRLKDEKHIKISRKSSGRYGIKNKVEKEIATIDYFENEKREFKNRAKILLNSMKNVIELVEKRNNPYGSRKKAYNEKKGKSITQFDLDQIERYRAKMKALVIEAKKTDISHGYEMQVLGPICEAIKPIALESENIFNNLQYSYIVDTGTKRKKELRSSISEDNYKEAQRTGAKTMTKIDIELIDR